MAEALEDMSGVPEALEDMCGVPENLSNYSAFPVKILNPSTRHLLAQHLNIERTSIGPTHGLLQDWRGLAEVFGFDNLEIENIQRTDSPTSQVLRQFEVRTVSPTIGLLIQALCQIERFDIVNDNIIQHRIGLDVENYCRKQNVTDTSPVQDDHVDSTWDEELRCMTVGEAVTGVPEYFDAFVCCTQQDGKTFIPAVMHHLEEKHGFKLFIADRDLIPGAANYVDLAKLIKERCRKMIIVLSQNYLQSEECKFATLFAQSLDPGAERRTLIPVKLEECAVPNILNYITLLDYSRPETLQWFWPRLASSLRADTARRILSITSHTNKQGPFTSPVTPVCGSAMYDTATRQRYFTAPVSTSNNLSPTTTDTTTTAQQQQQQHNITTHSQQSLNNNNNSLCMSTLSSDVTTDLNIVPTIQQITDTRHQTTTTTTTTTLGNLYNKWKKLRSK